MRRKIGMGFELTNREKESRDGAGGGRELTRGEKKSMAGKGVSTK